MSIPKLKFFALFFVFFAVFWQITTSFYIKMLSAGRQDFSRAAKGAAGLPRKESLRLFQPQAEGAVFCGALFFERRQNCRTPEKNLCRGATATKGGDVLSFRQRYTQKTSQKLAAEFCLAVRKLAPQNGAPFVLCPATVRPRQRGNRNNFVACLAKTPLRPFGLWLRSLQACPSSSPCAGLP